jgi:glucuronoarabinoxylan endo-1,4-beta-xylanase
MSISTAQTGTLWALASVTVLGACGSSSGTGAPDGSPPEASMDAGVPREAQADAPADAVATDAARAEAGMDARASVDASGSGTDAGTAALTVEWGQTLQTIDGFGASTAFAVKYSNAVADFLWDPSLGIGLSRVRDEISPNGWPTTATSVDSSGTATDGDFSVLQQASSRGAKAWATIWYFPTAWMGGQTNAPLDPSHYGDGANLLVTYVDRGWAAGVPIYAVSPMNEPDLVPSYAQTTWTQSQALTFVKNSLGPALATWAQNHPAWQTATGLSAPLIVVPETANWSDLSSWVQAFDSDSTAKGFVGVYATHQYYGGGASAPASPISHPIWETETFVQGEAYDDGIGSGISAAGLIDTALTTGHAQAWHLWFAEDNSDNDNGHVVGTNGSHWTNPQQALDDWNSPTLPKRAFVIGNYSKFVRPGWVRVAVSGSVSVSGLTVTAFRNPTTGDFAIVAVNGSGGSVTTSFGISGAGFSEVAPYVTSGTPLGAIGTDGNLSLGSSSAGIPSALSATGNVFSVTLPAGVTTFVGTAK